MRIRDPQRWAMILDANPLPPGCSPNPGTWLAWTANAGPDDRDALYAACVVVLAERWADAIEGLMDGAATVQWLTFDLADVALAMLKRLRLEFGPFAPNPYHVGIALAILTEVWAHGPALRTALDLYYLEHLRIPGRPS